ncbi:hypothetical protein BDN72DRAFT_605854 [Pluteus cervinus]|uniref:Uncharacterized protein n=1 Tax=Pluteus cervinus TaxID=181527 RepID=A0ACD3BAT3_9AGAR|nr:hypothetical protein BDN72DRAFT_605854 [Pluteus cervinus]
MSSLDLQILTLARNGRSSLVASFSLLVFEWLATLPSEIELIHSVPSRWSSIRIAFVLCRYYPLLAYSVILWAYTGDFSGQQCSHITRPVYALYAPSHFLGPAVMVLRAYAFAGRKFKILVLLSCCYALFFGIGVWVYWAGVGILPTEWFEHFGKTGCYPSSGDGIMGFRVGFAIGSSTLMDLVSLSVVLHCRKEGMDRWSLGKYFVAQGLGSFAIITMVNAAATIMYFQPQGSFSRIGLSFVIIINTITACRLILQLREKAVEMESYIDTQSNSKNEYTLTAPTTTTTTVSPSTNMDVWNVDDSDARPLVSSQQTV